MRIYTQQSKHPDTQLCVLRTVERAPCRKLTIQTQYESLDDLCHGFHILIHTYILYILYEIYGWSSLFKPLAPIQVGRNMKSSPAPCHCHLIIESSPTLDSVDVVYTQA